MSGPVSVPGTFLAADLGGWFTLLIIAFVVISNIGSLIRRAARTARSKPSPTVKAMTSAPSTMAATIADAASQTPDSARRTQRLGHVIQAIADQARASTTAADLEKKLRDLSGGASSAPAMGHGQVMSDLHTRADSAAPRGQTSRAPLAADMEPARSSPSPYGRMNPVAFDLAQAVINAAIVGPCVALRSAPQEPGGW